jgi:hypothetical protein
MPHCVSLRLIVPIAGLFVAVAQTLSSQPHGEFHTGPCVMEATRPDTHSIG